MGRRPLSGRWRRLRARSRANALLEAISDELECFLAVAAPLIEYGGRDGQEAVVRALAQVASEISRERAPRGDQRRAGVLPGRRRATDRIRREGWAGGRCPGAGAGCERDLARARSSRRSATSWSASGPSPRH